jgi:hypothetical protein
VDKGWIESVLAVDNLREKIIGERYVDKLSTAIVEKWGELSTEEIKRKEL